MSRDERFPMEFDVGPTEPSSVETEFDVDLSATSMVEHRRPFYRRLRDREYNDIVDALTERYRSATVGDLNELFRSLKTNSEEPANSQTYEWLVRRTLGCGGYVRGKDDAVKDRFSAADSRHEEVYADWYRLTQAFLQQNQISPDLLFYRGLYEEEFVRILEAALVNPFASAYDLHSSVVTSFTLWSDVACDYSEGMVVCVPPIREAVAFGGDMLVDPPAHTGPEAEVHVLSGALRLHADRFFVHFRSDDYGTDEMAKLHRTVKSLLSPEALSAADHENVYAMVELLAEFYFERIDEFDGDAPLAQSPARILLWTWVTYAETQLKGLFDRKELRLIRRQVEFLVGAERSTV